LKIFSLYLKKGGLAHPLGNNIYSGRFALFLGLLTTRGEYPKKINKK
jgi:hypothetical protein